MPESWDEIDDLTGWWIRASIIEYNLIRTLEDNEQLAAMLGATRSV